MRVGGVKTQLLELLDSDLPVDDLAAAVRETQWVINLGGELLRRLASVAGRSGCWADEGFQTVGGWLSHHAGLSRRAANACAREARLLAEMPHSAAAAAAGALTGEQVGLLTGCRAAATDRYDAATDAAFVAVGRVEELRPVAVSWRAHAQAADCPDPLRAPNRPEVASVQQSWDHRLIASSRGQTSRHCRRFWTPTCSRR